VAHPQVDGFELHPSGSARPQVGDQAAVTVDLTFTTPNAAHSPFSPISPPLVNWLCSFATTLAGGCARPPLARGQLPVSVTWWLCAGGPLVPAVQVCAGQAASASGACAVHMWGRRRAGP
jgi:hypothetical protein